MKTAKRSSEIPLCFSFNIEGHFLNTLTGGNAKSKQKGGQTIKQQYPTKIKMKKGANTMNTTITSAALTSRKKAESEPVKYVKRIGSTTFVVAVHFSRADNDTAMDKTRRLIQREVEQVA